VPNMYESVVNINTQSFAIHPAFELLWLHG
jgi:hypothetical protein